MSARLPLLLVALLALTAPAVSAQGELSLTVQPGFVQRTASAGAAVDVALDYTLDNGAARPLQLISKVTSNGQPVAHTATWSLQGKSTSADSPAVTSTVAAGQHPFVVTFTLPGAAGTGTYKLDAYVREHAAASGGSGSGSSAGLAPAAGARTELSLQRSLPGGGSSGGGGGGASVGPGLVTGLAARDVTDQSLLLAWDAASGAEGYRVYRGLQAGFEPGASSLTATVTAPQHLDDGLSGGTTYHYRVRAFAGTQEGPLSTELAVRTLPGADRVPPSQVTGLQVTKATSRSIALAWEPAFDDGGHVSYEVHRGAAGFATTASTRIATATATSFVDTGLVPSTTYTYRVRAVDAALNAGAASDAVEARTLQATEDDLRPPAVVRVSFTADGAGWTLAWATDERAAATVFLEGAGHPPRNLDAGSGIAFSIRLGALDAGHYTYAISAVDDLGAAGTRSGSFVVEPGALGRYEALSPAHAQAVAVATVGTTGTPLDLYLVDHEQDGRIDALMEASGRLQVLHGLPGERRFLVAATGGGDPVLVGTDGRVDAVARVAAKPTGSHAGEAVLVVEATVAKQAGWILASLDDPHPDLPLLGVERADGTPLPAEAVWRDGRLVRFLDDPDTTYRVLYDNAGRDAGGSAGSGLPSWALWVAVGVGGMLAGMALMALVLRRRA